MATETENAMAEAGTTCDLRPATNDAVSEAVVAVSEKGTTCELPVQQQQWAAGEGGHDVATETSNSASDAGITCDLRATTREAASEAIITATDKGTACELPVTPQQCPAGVHVTAVQTAEKATGRDYAAHIGSDASVECKILQEGGCEGVTQQTQPAEDGKVASRTSTRPLGPALRSI